MLTLGALACTFDHSGLLPGAADADLADASDAELPDGAAGDTGGGEMDGGDASAETISTLDGDAATDSPARPDGNLPSDVSQPEGGTVDGPLDASGSETDARFDCASVPGGVTFTPPGGANAHCYWVHATASNWLGAANACVMDRGHLVTLTSSAETTFVLGLVPPIASNDRLWIGGTDGRFSSDGPGSGPFVWITGEPMTYQNWASNGQPDGSCKTCAGAPCECEHRLAILSDGRWEDLYEALYYRSVCEAEL
jgi:hypothetical protein